MSKYVHTILIVDEEQACRLLLEAALRPHFLVFTAQSGAEALQTVRREDISLLITARAPGGMSGTALIRAAHAIRPEMVSMLLTSNRDAETFVDAIVMNKPWERAALLSVVRASLEIYDELVARTESMVRVQQARETLGRVAVSG